MAERRGRDVLLEVLRTEGVRHLFGNPGSTELPLIDALATAEDLHYVLALQEATAVGMADGYAQATGRPAFVNLHTSAGLGNAIGNLTNAAANRAPLVVTAGQQHTAHLAAEPMLSGDLVGLAAATVKWGQEVRHPGEMGTVLRRAFHDAARPPEGPVFVSLRMDHLDATGDWDIPPPSEFRLASVPHTDVLHELAALLSGAGTGEVAIVAGDELASPAGAEALDRLSRALGAPVFSAPLHGRGLTLAELPLWQGMLAPAAAAIRSRLTGYRMVLLLGDRGFLVYPYTDGSPLPEGCDLLHVSADGSLLGRHLPTRLGVLGHVPSTVGALARLLETTLTHEALDRAAGAVRAAWTARQTETEELEQTARDRYGADPMHPMAAAHALVRALPAGTPVVDEAITTGGYVRGFHHRAVQDGYFFCRGGGLGWGMPAACGVSLARDRTPVLCAVGDGSALYSPQALWTAAHEALPVVFAVLNNRCYRILRDNLRASRGDSAASGRFVAMDLDQPPVDFVSLATSMGVTATRVESAGDVGDCVRAALAAGRPHLLELPIDPG